MIRICLYIFLFLFAHNGVTAEDIDKDWNKRWEKLEIEKLMPPSKSISKTCRKFQNKFISYYSDVYYVDSCKRRKVASKDIYRISKKNVKIQPIKSDVLADLLLGKPYVYRKSLVRGCHMFSRKYVTTSFTNIYFVQNCVKRKFPDWVSYKYHRKKNGFGATEPVYELTHKEMAKIKTGSEFFSVLDSREVVGASKKLDQIDVIPVDEACEGLNKKFVYYYSKVYYIDQCQKKSLSNVEYNALMARFPETSMIELTSSQWISLPDGGLYNK